MRVLFLIQFAVAFVLLALPVSVLAQDDLYLSGELSGEYESEVDVYVIGTRVNDVSIVATNADIFVLIDGISGTNAIPPANGGIGQAGVSGANSSSLTLRTIESGSIYIMGPINLSGIDGSSGGSGTDGYVEMISSTNCNIINATAGGAAGNGGHGGHLLIESVNNIVFSIISLQTTGGVAGSGGSGGSVLYSLRPLTMSAGIGRVGGAGGTAGSIDVTAIGSIDLGDATFFALGGNGGGGGAGGGDGSSNRVGGNGGAGGAGGVISFSGDDITYGGAVVASGGNGGSGAAGGRSARFDCSAIGYGGACNTGTPTNAAAQAGGRGGAGGLGGNITFVGNVVSNINNLSADGGFAGTSGASGDAGWDCVGGCFSRTAPATGAAGQSGGGGGSITLTSTDISILYRTMSVKGGNASPGSRGGSHAAFTFGETGICAGCGYTASGVPSRQAGSGGQGGSGGAGGVVQLSATTLLTTGSAYVTQGGLGGNGGDGGQPQGIGAGAGGNGTVGSFSSSGGTPPANGNATLPSPSAGTTDTTACTS